MARDPETPVTTPAGALCGWIAPRHGGRWAAMVCPRRVFGKFPTAAAAQDALITIWQMLWCSRRRSTSEALRRGNE
jgi:hypothetical protein